jgi:hypothetical protein
VRTLERETWTLLLVLIHQVTTEVAGIVRMTARFRRALPGDGCHQSWVALILTPTALTPFRHSEGTRPSALGERFSACV